MFSTNLIGKLTMQLIHEQCALTSRKQNNTMKEASINCCSFFNWHTFDSMASLFETDNPLHK